MVESPGLKEHLASHLMMGESPALGVVVKPDRPDAKEILRSLYNQAQSLGWRVLLDEVGGPLLGLEGMAREAMAGACKAFIVLGGDGTFLAAARPVRHPDIPIVGINLGHLGFLTEFSVNETPQALELLLEGKLSVQRRMRLEARVVREDIEFATYHCLNDVVVARGTLARIISLQLATAQGTIMDVRADGVIMATPTGSTAYNLSAGGPIVEPGQYGILITPLAPHGLTARPLFLDPESEITLTFGEDPEAAFLTADGQMGMPLQTGDVLHIRRSPFPLSIGCSPTRGFWSILAEKMGWNPS